MQPREKRKSAPPALRNERAPRLPDWTQKELTDQLGSAVVEPAADALAGEHGTWRITYRVGRWGIDERGSIKLTFRQVSDWGAPQFDDPQAPNYTTVRLESRSGARLSPRFEWRGYIRHWRQALTIDVLDDCLWEGDTIVIVLGDTSGGGPGMAAQTFDESVFEFKVFVDPFGAGNFQPMPGSPRIRVRPGPAVRLVAILPTEAAVGERGWLLVKAEDRHGNPAEGGIGEVAITAEGARLTLPGRIRLPASGFAVARSDEIRFEQEGVARIRIRDAQGREALSNPVVVRPAIEGSRVHWGDFHGGQTGGTVGVGSIGEFYRFARDVAALEFTTHQGNCFEVTAEDMEELKRATRAFHEPGRFVPFLGYEWSGTTPMGGDHNLFFFEDDAPLHRCSHWLQSDFSDIANDRDHITKLYETLRGTRVISLPHVGGRPADLAHHDPELEPVVEVHSKHGMFEWMIEDAIRHGHRVGFVAGSDDHYGHPGACYPGPHVGHFACRNGLTALYADDLTRQAVWSALKARRCYGTSGERIYLRFTVDGRWMGDEVACVGAPRIEIETVGTGPIERVEIFRGLTRIHVEDVAGRDAGHRLRVLFAGARVRGRGRATKWDGRLDLAGARLVAAEPIAFIADRDTITERTGNGLAWHLYTAGDARGFILALDRPDGEMSLSTGPAKLTASITELLERPRVVEAGGLGQRIEIERPPAPGGPWQAHFGFEDRDAPAGVHAYWVRVVQADQEKAWASPVWARAPGGRRS